MRADRSYLYDKTYNFMNTTHHTHSCVHDTVSSVGANNFGMNDRIKRLRRQTFEAQPSLSIERALIETRFYQENYGKYPIPILRALNFLEICKRKTIYIGEDELIVGERGPCPKPCLPSRNLPAGGLAYIEYPGAATLHHQSRRYRYLRAGGDPVLERPYPAGTHLQPRPQGMERGVRGGYVHRVRGQRAGHTALDGRLSTNMVCWT